MFVLLVINAAIYVHYINGVIRDASRCDSFLSLRILKEFKSVYIRVTSFTENSPCHRKQITATKRRSARAGRTFTFTRYCDKSFVFLNRSDQYWKDKVIGKFKLARIGLPLSYDITL